MNTNTLTSQKSSSYCAAKEIESVLKARNPGGGRGGDITCQCGFSTGEKVSKKEDKEMTMSLCLRTIKDWAERNIGNGVSNLFFKEG